MIRIRTWIPLGLILALVLGACASSDPAPLETEAVIVDAPAATATPAQEEEASQEEAEAEDAEASAEGVLIFSISQEGSEARFIIDEVLRNEPKTVVGVTSKVSGEISVDPANPLSTGVGEISIDAGDFRTDSNFRNTAINDFILQSGRYPKITFTPTSINGLPDNANVGETYEFEIVGDLTIREITKEVTFKVSVTAESEVRLEGFASASIFRTEYELNIPSVPQVASVENAVFLELDFTATR